MLPPDWPYSPALLGVVLVALLGSLAIRAWRKDKREYRRFKRYRSTLRRQAVFRKWLLESLIWFGGWSLVVLALAWQFTPLMLQQIDTWPAMRAFQSFLDDWGVLVGAAGGLLVVTLIASVFLVRDVETVPTVGDIHALLPRNGKELRYGAALSINAGVVEELLFRLALPTLVFGMLGDALVAVVVSVLLFGALHVYQGVWGVVATTVIGGLLMVLLLVSGSILWPIVAHALFDLRSLVLIPVIVYKVHSVPR